MKSFVIVSFFFILSFWEAKSGYAQINLVPNWSFEEYNSCPTLTTQSCYSSYLSIPALKDWYCAFTDFSTPDYYNSCSPIPHCNFNSWLGYQKPKTGNAYIGGGMWNANNGVGSYNIEYIQCKLKASLKSNVNYCVQYFVNKADNSTYAISQYGSVFTNTSITESGSTFPVYINIVPQVKNPLGSFIIDSIGWTKIENTFVASGSEQFMTLGCFGIQSLSDTLFSIDSVTNQWIPPYYYLDDVSVEEVLNAQAGVDKTINCGDTTVIGADSAIGASYKWFPSAGLNYDTLAFPMATPTITTKYVVQKTQCKIITYDTVIVNVTNTCPYINYQDEFIIPNVFTPNGDNVNDVWSFNLGFGNTLKGLYVYNRWGNIEHVTSSIDNVSFIKWDGRTTSGVECSSGVYFYVLEYTNILGEQKKVNGYISLIK